MSMTNKQKLSFNISVVKYNLEHKSLRKMHDNIS